MQISIFALVLIVVAAIALGWLLRSYLYRTQSAKVAQFDAAAKRVGESAEDAYTTARTKVVGAYDKATNDKP